MTKRLLTESQLLTEMPFLTSNRLRYLREKRRIPFVRHGWRSVLYCPEDIAKALEHYKVKAMLEI